MDFEGLPPAKTFTCGARADPTSVALGAAGTQMVLRRGFRVVGADGKPQLPLLSKDFQVRAPEDRLVRKDGKRDWRLGVCPVPRASRANVSPVSAHCDPQGRRSRTADTFVFTGPSWLPDKNEYPCVDRNFTHGRPEFRSGLQPL